MFIIFIISGEASLCCLALEPCRVSLYKWCYFLFLSCGVLLFTHVELFSLFAMFYHCRWIC